MNRDRREAPTNSGTGSGSSTGPAWPAALALVAVMGFGAWQTVAACLTPGGLDVPRSWRDFREGRTTTALEKQIDLHLPARGALIAAANSARYLLVGGAGEQVRSGRNGWLFLTDELRVERGAAAHLQARADLLQAASLALALRGTRLVVALVPDKARVQAAALPDATYLNTLQWRYPAALAALRQRQVIVVDLMQPLGAAAGASDMYYRSDTHWNQAGANVAARAIAQAVLGLDPALEPALPRTAFATTIDAIEQERAGDLLRMMGLDAMPAALRPPADRERAAHTRQTSEDAAAGLFGDVEVPIALTGTSYSLRANFHGFLQEALAAKVLNAAKDGAGFLQATTAYLKDESFTIGKPRVLIWEIPERFLTPPLADETGWMARAGLQP